MDSIKMENVVGIERIVDNDIRSAVFSALEAVQAGRLMDREGMAVLLKPIVLMAKPPEEAATTHPSIMKAVIQWVTIQPLQDLRCLFLQRHHVRTDPYKPEGFRYPGRV